MCRPVDPGADRLLPLIALRNVITFQVVAARQAQKRRMHRRQHLHQVDPIAMRPVMVCRREQRHEIKPNRSRPWNCQDQMVVCRRRYLSSCLKRKRVLCPITGESVDLGLRHDSTRLIIDDAYGNRDTYAVGLCVEGSGIGRLRPYRNTPESIILHASRSGRSRRSR